MTKDTTQPTQKFPVILTISTVIGAIILMGLGTWQLQRLQWKTALIQELNTAYAAPAKTLSEITEFNNVKAVIEGQFLADQNFFIQSKTHNRTLGRHFLTPFKTIEGTIIIVNRGWIPLDWTPTEQRTTNLNLTGVFRTATKPNGFIPDNDSAKGLWYWADVPAMHQDALPALFWQSEAITDNYPTPVGTKPSLKNDHLQYAFFWFTMATALIIVYSAYLSRHFQHMVPDETEADESDTPQ